jgi:hypothetical protein
MNKEWVLLTTLLQQGTEVVNEYNYVILVIAYQIYIEHFIMCKSLALC